MDEININAVKANEDGTPQSIFREAVKLIPRRETFDLKQYAAKLQLKLLFRKRKREEDEKALELHAKKQELEITISRKRHLLKVEVDEHEVLNLAKRAKITILQLEAVKEHISYPPQRSELTPKVTILLKNVNKRLIFHR
jgi:hypothetical protein